jgi:hypothetical protein
MLVLLEYELVDAVSADGKLLREDEAAENVPLAELGFSDLPV